MYDPLNVKPMIPTYVFGWPTSKEHGDFLALDLGMLSIAQNVTENMSPAKLRHVM
jgi:hypothetical protein